MGMLYNRYSCSMCLEKFENPPALQGCSGVKLCKECFEFSRKANKAVKEAQMEGVIPPDGDYGDYIEATGLLE